MRILELLHFYTTTTSFTFSTIPERQNLWHRIVPQIAFNYRFLLHGILSISALQLAYLQPANKASLYAEASVHHQISVAEFRSAMLEITQENCHACFAVSSLLFFYAWASSEGIVDIFFASCTVKDTTIEWVGLVRGSSTLLMAAWSWLLDGPLGVLFRVPGEPPLNGSPEEDEKLASLQQLWDAPHLNFDVAEVEALNKALALLREVNNWTPDFGTEICAVAATLSWVVQVPEAFIVMVSQRRPEALVLLAHYCIVLSKVDHFWWINGMSRQLLQTIHSSLGKEWESSIGWPLQELVLSEFRNKTS